jgi:S-formylglutathione hydrolase FrmB
MKLLRLFLVFWLLVACSQAQSRIDCNEIKSHVLRETVHYCVMLPAGYDAPKASTLDYPVLYFLHGLGGNEQELFQMGGWDLVQDLRREHKISDFLIVTPEAKASFYVNSANGKLRYSDFFLHEFMPLIESKYRIRRERSSRAVSGISMGGYGALRFAFAYPELFSAVSAESAALMPAPPQELDAMLRSDSSFHEIMAPVFGDPIDGAHWQENNPFDLAKKNEKAIRHLAIYFSCGRDDQYQFEVGAEKLDRELDAERIKHTFHLYPGDHSASYFLAHLAEEMEFHSQNFPPAK